MNNEDKPNIKNLDLRRSGEFENEYVHENGIYDKNSSSAEVDEFNDSISNEFLNEDTLQEKDRCSALKNGSASTETVEENVDNIDSAVGGSDFISESMNKIINERIKELLDLPDVTNFIKSKKKDSQ